MSTHASADTNSVFQFAGVFGRALAPIMGDATRATYANAHAGHGPYGMRPIKLARRSLNGEGRQRAEIIPRQGRVTR